jgi:chromosome segregation ATPase
VKTGKDFCKIEITLLNYGVLSDRYGKEIIIQRIIDSNGVSTYKIDDGKSRLRVLKRAELDNILATLGIMLDNPVAILNQETARSFLRSKDPRDK